jgi:N-acetylneuraminic acid mutarotase
MYVLGGQSIVDGAAQSTFLRLDLASGEWRELPATPLGAIAEHTAVVFDGVMWVFGGVDARGRASNALWTYTFASQRWSQMEVDVDASLAPQVTHYTISTDIHPPN